MQRGFAAHAPVPALDDVTSVDADVRTTVQQEQNLELNLDATRPLIFAADVHLKPQWSAMLPNVTEDSAAGLDEYLHVINETNAAAIILGGDIFDSNYVKHLWLQQLFFSWVDRVEAAGCRVLAYPGNHDFVLHQLDPTHPIHIHSIHPGVVDLDGCSFRHGDRHYACIGHRDHPAQLVKEFAELPEDVDTLLLHQLIVQHGGSTNLGDVPEHVRTILLGDVHEFSDGTNQHGAWWGYPGCMFPQNVAERDHGVFVVDSNPQTEPMRQVIAARSAKAFDVNDDADIASQVSIAAAWVSQRRSWIQQLLDDGDRDYLAPLERPVVYFRVARNLVGDVKKAVAHDEIGDLAHVYVKPISVVRTVQVDLGAATKSVPTPIELLPHYVERIKEQPSTVKAYCPAPDASAALVRELLLSGGAGRKAGDDERRADGKPLAHKALIAAALAELDEEAE